MKQFFLVVLMSLFGLAASAQSTVYVRNSTWQDFEVEVSQYGTLNVNASEWSEGDPLVRAWIESTGQDVLAFNRTNTAVPENDTAYFNIALNGPTDTLTIKLRLIGISGGTELDYSVEGNGFSESWYDDGDFHEVATILNGKTVIVKFKPDNDDSNMDRDVRFAIHDLPVYDLDEADFQDPNVLNVMFYNIQMISFGVSGMPQANDRGALLPAQISEYQDVVSFAEAFDDGPREDHLIPAMETAGFPYYTEILNEPGGIIPFPVNGGVIIFSRWPIEAEGEIDFAECGQASQDCLAQKGVKYAKINKLGKSYHVFGTHMDAGSQSDDIHARRTQMAEIRDFIADLNIPEGEAVVFGGDFNTDPVGSDMDYQAFLDTMNPIIPQPVGYWESGFSDNFGKIIDHAWADRNHLVPIEATNEVITIRSLDPVLWDLSEFSDHRCVLGRFEYPDFSKTGGDTLICPGDDLTLSVNTTYPVTYQWYKDGVEMNGETNSTLEFVDATESQAGNYSCVVGYDVLYGDWSDSLSALFYPNGPVTAEADLTFEFGEIVIDEMLCHVGIGEIENSGIIVFPNSAGDRLNVVAEDFNGSSELALYSISGSLVYKKIHMLPKTSIDISSLSKGVYVLRIDMGDKVFRQQVVVY